MIDLGQLVLGIVQGITELLPVSSSGHLILFGEIFTIDYTLAFLTLLHVSTLGGIIIGYWREILAVLASKNRWRIFINIAISIAPSAIFGVIVGSVLDEYFYNIPFIVFTLIAWGAAMILTERLEVKKDQNKLIGSIEQISPKDALVIGLLQPLALFPGTSRSGITTLAGIWRGIRKDIALEYAFIAGIPLIAGSFLYELIKNYESFSRYMNIGGAITVALTLLVSIGAIAILKRVSRKMFLTIFGWYRIFLGVALIGYLLLI